MRWFPSRDFVLMVFLAGVLCFEAAVLIVRPAAVVVQEGGDVVPSYLQGPQVDGAPPPRGVVSQVLGGSAPVARFGEGQEDILDRGPGSGLRGAPLNLAWAILCLEQDGTHRLSREQAAQLTGWINSARLHERAVAAARQAVLQTLTEEQRQALLGLQVRHALDNVPEPVVEGEDLGLVTETRHRLNRR